MSIGIGITTRNRPEVLKTCLSYFSEFGYGDKLVIVDDSSYTKEENKKVIEDSGLDVLYRYSNQRLGIAKAKNACISKLIDMDHIFLFDDDTWPKAHNWAEKWIEINQVNGAGHSMWNIFTRSAPGSPEQVRADIEIIKEWINTEINTDDNRMIAWSNCLGVMLYFSKECIRTLGGYDHSAESFYGYEHAQISQRAAKAGFCLGHPYLSPAICPDLVYSFDISYRWLSEEPIIDIPWKDNFRSSVTQEEADQHPKNSRLMSFDNTYIPLIDPIED